jgi:hypothetical protein
MSSRTRRRALEKAAAKKARTPAPPAVFTPPLMTEHKAKILISMGGAVVTGDNHLSVNAKKAWSIDEWIWTVADRNEQIELLGDDAPHAIYVCRDYQASIFTVPDPGDGWPPMWHLSIKRKDREPIDENRWRLLQHIKNTLVGPEHEAVELYPAESRLVDTCNQYHLWVFQSGTQQWPFGFTSRMVTSEEIHGTKQRPLPPGTDEGRSEAFKVGMDALYGKKDETP